VNNTVLSLHAVAREVWRVCRVIRLFKPAGAMYAPAHLYARKSTPGHRRHRREAVNAFAIGSRAAARLMERIGINAACVPFSLQ
jgi:hypothetical protein